MKILDMEQEIKMKETILVWHFGESTFLSNKDGRIVKPGRIYKNPVDYDRKTGPIKFRIRGFHGSILPIDALSNNLGTWVELRELRGNIINKDGNYCSSEFKCIFQKDAARTLIKFAVWCAKRTLKENEKLSIDPYNLLVVQTVDRWLKGKATEEEVKSIYGKGDHPSFNVGTAACYYITNEIDFSVIVAANTLCAANYYDKNLNKECKIRNRKLHKMLMELGETS